MSFTQNITFYNKNNDSFADVKTNDFTFTCRVGGMENDKEGSVPWFPINNLLTKVFSSEKLVLPTLSLPFGVHILVIATNLKNY